jgi:hypothetical protein
MLQKELYSSFPPIKIKWEPQDYNFGEIKTAHKRPFRVLILDILI